MIDPADPPVLLVHGTGSTIEHNYAAHGWIDLLSDAGRRTVGVHLPGHGPDPGSADASGAAAVLAAAGSGPADAVGFSAGAHAVLAAAIARPAAFRRIALLGGGDAMAGLTDADATAQADMIADAITGGASAESGDPTGMIFARLVRSAGNDPEKVARFLRATSDPITPAELHALHMPVLVVLGEHDFAGPADRLVAALPDARLEVVRGVDHFALTSDFGCLDAVLEFLAA